MFLVVSICSGLFGVIFIDEVFLRASPKMMDGSHHYWKEGGYNTNAMGVGRFVTLFRNFRIFSSRKDKQSKERP